MARPVTPRPPAEHIKVLGRMRRQIEIDDEMAGRRKTAIIENLDSVVEKLSAEEAKRA